MPNPTSLFLAPADLEAAPPREPIIRLLADLAITDSPIDGNTFTAGDGFSRHVVFAGCSPHLVMTPPTDGSLAFCHVAAHGPFIRPYLVVGPNTVKPRCPACRARFDDWRTALDGWREADASADCPSCGQRWQPGQLDWRGHAISGCMLIELRNVFPGEASPSDVLMLRLQDATEVDWRYAWAGSLETSPTDFR